MTELFDSETEAKLRRARKMLVWVMVPVMIVALLAAVAVGLLIRSGAIPRGDVTPWFRGAAVLIFVGLAFSGFLLREGFLREGLRLPIVRALIPLAAFSVGLLFSGSQATPQFFAVAAEVIPVLVLALAIEGRAFSLNRLPGDHWLVREIFKLSALGTMFVLAGGEGFALAGASQTEPSPFYTGIVAGAVGAGFAGVMTFSMLGLFSPLESKGAVPDDSD